MTAQDIAKEIILEKKDVNRALADLEREGRATKRGVTQGGSRPLWQLTDLARQARAPHGSPAREHSPALKTSQSLKVKKCFLMYIFLLK